MQETLTEKNGLSPADLERAGTIVGNLESSIHRDIIGKRDIVRSVIEAVIARGHVLVEGVPGLAKTLLVKSLALSLGLDYSRIQFTPDLLPADLTGTPVYDPRTMTFSTRKGPLFANIILADEVNRAPAKVQSALLEAMEERQITLGDTTLPLPSPFYVFATQNPIEHEGTYSLPEAELDRFLCKIVLGYPDENEELEIVMRSDALGKPHRTASVSKDELSFISACAERVRVDGAVAEYAVRIVRSSRPAKDGDETRFHPSISELHRYIEVGASPRAAIALFKVARAKALMEGRGFVLPDDIKSSVPDVMRHRIVPNYEAGANGLETMALVERLLLLVKVP